MKTGLRGTLLLAGVAIALLASCREVDVTAVDVATVEVTPGSARLLVGETATLQVRVADALGRTLKRQVEWTSSDASIADVGSNGQVQARAPGTATIRATVDGKTGQAAVDVVSTPVATVDINPSIATLEIGDSIRLEAVARAANGSVLANRVATWTSSDNAVASILPDGFAHALAVGSATITATIEGVRGQATVNVRAALVTVSSVGVQPVSASIGVGDTVRFTALARDANGQVIPGRTATWTSASPAIASVDNAGLARGHAMGSAAIVATVDGVSGQAAVTVTPPTVVAVEIVPPSTTLAVSNSLQLRATIRASDGSVVTGVPVTWAVDLPAVASVDQTGLITGRSVGEAIVTASAAGHTGTAKIFVVLQPVSSISISPANPSLFARDTVILTAILLDANNAPITGRPVTWGVSDSTVASIEVTGPATQQARLIGLRAGSVKVEANAEARSAATQATVNPLADVFVTQTASAALVKAGDTITFAIRVHNAGPSPAESIVTSDKLPGTGTFIDATGGATLSNGVLTWPSVAALAPGDSLVYTVRVRAGTASLTNAAAAMSVTADRDTGNNSAAITVSVNPPDLVVTKTAPSARVNAGETIPFTITVKNSGTSPAGSVSVTDSLPAGATFIDATGNPLHSGNLLVWPLVGSLPAGGTLSYTVRIQAPPSGSVINAATASSPAGDANPADNHDRAVVAIDPLSDLVVSKTASTATANAGDVVSYSVRVRNLGPSPAAAVVVTDTLPANASFVAGSAGNASLANNVLTWPVIPSLAAGDSAVFALSVVAPASGSVRNVAAAVTATAESSLANNNASATTSVNAADMTVAKSGPVSAAPGETITYTILVSNAGPGRATSVVVTDTLAPGLTFVSAPNGGTLGGNVVTWPTLQSLDAGASVQYTVSVIVAAGTQTDVAAVTAATADPDPSNNHATATTVAAQADLAASKTGPASVLAGATITWSITVNNNGQSPATGVVLQDTLPQGVTFVSATGGGTFANGVVTWSAASLAGGQNVIVSVEALAPNGAATLTNVARVSAATRDPDPTNNRSTTTTTVEPVANLGVTKTGTAQVNPNGSITYQIGVTNVGPSPAVSVVVSDTLPAGVTFVSATGGGVHSNGVVTWQISSLASGANAAFTVGVNAPGTAASLTNVVHVSSATKDPDTTNDRATAVTTVTQANLKIDKSGPATATVADPLVYTLTVSNAGPNTATGVVVHDTLPAGTTLSSANPQAQPSGGVLTWNLGPLASGAAQVITVTLSPAAAGTVTNAADAASAVDDPDLSDNHSTLTTTVTPAANVSVQMVASSTSPSAGDTVVYTITVQNAGPSDATGVVVTDVLPTNGTFVDATGGVTPVGGVLTFAGVPSLAPAGSIIYSVRVLAAAKGTMTNQASVTAATPDPVTSNNGATVIVSIAAADIDVSMSGPVSVGPGDPIEYTITLANNGPGRALGVTLNNTLPTNAVVVDLQPAPNGAGSTSAVPQWVESELAAGDSRTYTIQVTAPLIGNVVNSASAFASTLDPTPNTASVTTTVNPLSADLSVAVGAPANTVNGETITYTIDVNNAGPGYGLALQVVNTISSKVSYVPGSATGPVAAVYNATSQTLTWVVLQQAPGAPLSFSFMAVVNGNGNITNTAAVTAVSPDPDTANNSATVQTRIN
jgi:uncharacterized repeat protein (TIGR01451 family)